MKHRKMVCSECGWVGFEAHLSTLRYQWTDSEGKEHAGEWEVCPDCGGLDATVDFACDEPDCRKKVTCGAPTPDGYKATCSDHMPKETL